MAREGQGYPCYQHDMMMMMMMIYIYNFMCVNKLQEMMMIIIIIKSNRLLGVPLTFFSILRQVLFP